jgi:signal transduction histidine kinase
VSPPVPFRNARRDLSSAVPLPLLTDRRLRGWILLVLTAVAVAVTGGLALEAWRATERHRVAAEAALRDHVGFAATSYRQQLISHSWVGVDNIFRPVGHRRLAAASTPLPPVTALREAAARVTRCQDCGATLEPAYYFRLMVADSSLELDGPPLPPARRALVLSETLRLGIGGKDQEWDYTSFVDTLAPALALVYLTARRGGDGAPLAIYGFGVAMDDVARAFLRPPLEAFPLLALPARQGLTNDSLLSVSLLRPDGRVGLALSPHEFPDRYAVRIPASRFLGAWTLRVSLDPRAAPAILPGGLPRTRTPLLAALALTAAALLLSTLVVAWRALELAGARAQFVASVSHELRTPLSQILLFGESLTLGTMRTRRDVRVAAGVIVGEARRLLRLVDNVLLFGREASGAGDAAPVPLAPLVRDVVAGFAPVAAAAESRLRTVRVDDVEAPADDGSVRQVLLNLLDNAVKYGPRGQTISLGLALAGRRARLWVEDEGPGIPAADRTRVWRLFVRLERDVDRQAAGSGIGLSLVREIVARHRGTAAIESTPAGGTRVVVELPDARPLQETSCAS